MKSKVMVACTEIHISQIAFQNIGKNRVAIAGIFIFAAILHYPLLQNLPK